jgi:hypothetical protein
MPKNTVTDPITDREIAFAHLILSGTMTDRRAAEAVGLNPETAAYTKAKPRVRDYMIEHRAAVKEKLVDQEAAGLRKLSIGRDQILNRLWELATLSHEATRGSITGQMKALAMIAAIEGLIPSGKNARRLSPSATEPTASPLEPQIDISQWLRAQQHQAVDEEPGDAIGATEVQPAPSHAPEPDSAPKPGTDAPTPPSGLNFARSDDRDFDPKELSFAGSLISQALNRVPLATNSGFDAAPNSATSPRQPFSLKKGRFGRRR